MTTMTKVREGIYRRGKSYAIVVDLPRGPDGKRRQKWQTFDTLAKAAKARRSLLVNADRGEHVEASKDTVAQILDLWLTEYADVSVRKETAEGYRAVARLWIVPHIGDVRLDKLNDSHIKGMLAALREPREGKEPLSGRSQRNAYRVLKKALSWAARQKGPNGGRLLSTNPADEVDAPKVEAVDMRTLNEAETVRLLQAAADSPIAALVHLAVFTGMRRSELLGLQWRDVDLTLANIQVRRGLHSLKGGVIRIEEPKSLHSRRKVDLSPTAVLALRRHREQMEAHAASLDATITNQTPVFARPDLTPMLPDSVSHQFARVAKKAGLGTLGLHALRHTHASHLLKQGIHPKVVQERLGHSSIQITLDLYSHVAPGMQEAAANRFEDGLRAAGLGAPALATF